MDEQSAIEGGNVVWRALAAGTALLWASLVNFLVYNDFPVLRPEALTVAAALFALCGLMALFYKGQRRWGRALLEGLLALLFVDLNSTSLPLALGVGAALGLFSWWRDRSLLGPMTIVGSVVLIATILGVGGGREWIYSRESRGPNRTAAAPAQPVRATASKPAILHIILDEQIGIAGVRGEGAAQLRSDLKRFYLDRGFALYDRAYSEHLHTVNAVPYVLNYGEGLATRASKNGARIGPLKHFQTLHRLGYRLTVLQSDFAEFCEGNVVAECLTYLQSSPRPLLTTSLSFRERTTLVALKFLSLSQALVRSNLVINSAMEKLGWLGVPAPTFEIYNYARSSTVAALAATDVLATRLRSARPGEAFFAHLLLPHYPHVVRSDCSYLPRTEWRFRRGRATLAERQRTYLPQVRCTMRKIDELLRAFAASPGGSNGIVIIHGDHGSRIVDYPAIVENIGRYSVEDVIADHSTLFAIRGPGIQATSFAEPESIAPLLRDFAASGFTKAPVPHRSRPASFVVSDAQWRPRQRVPMPAVW